VDAAADRGRLTAEELRAWRGLVETSARLRHRLDRLLLADSGLSGSDYPVLVSLHEAGVPLRSSELADRIGWERSRLSHHLARMERRGLVGRTPHAGDQRGSEVSLTPAGRSTFLAATAGHSAAVRAHFADVLTPEQLTSLAQIMETLQHHLDTTAPGPT
jgi:DNA-binding MarR family transcriptional regulator